MKKECCNVKVTEVDNGYRVDITGDDIKEKCKTIIENCNCEEKIKKCFETCCGSEE